MSSLSQMVYAQDKAVIKEKTETIKTYPYSDPNPIASVAINDQISPFYPYFMWNGYTTKSSMKDWDVITLENPFIKVKVLPEVGGKVWGAIEKSTGKEFVYLNHVLKFRAIGIRGPWTSGGIEHNFGLDLGHAPWTASPVDYIKQENPDGSVSVIVGGLDLASRTEWRVDIRLPKDKAYFETNTLWYNPTPLHGSYLAWENAGFKTSNDMQFFYPGTHTIFHDGHAFPWPIDAKGHNLAWYKENNFGGHKSYHVMGTYTDWFGGYWHNDDFGFGHWSPYSDAPGKKIWLWSLAREGGIWEDLLTDTDGQYMEAQAGAKFNQAGPESGFYSPFNQLSLHPNRTDVQTHAWFPVKKTGGMSDSSPYGTLNVISLGDSLKINISPNVYLKDSLVVTQGDTPIHSEKLALKPMESYNKGVAVKKNASGDISVRVGKNKLSYTVGKDIYQKNKLDRPVRTTTNEDYDSPARLLRLAEDENAMREYGKALADYQQVLKKEPTNSKALSRVAELYYRKALYKEGSEYALKVLENNTYDPSANYIYGALQKQMGHLIKAEEALGVAARSMEYRSDAYAQIAGIKLRQQAYDQAERYAKRALNFNKYNLKAYEFLGTNYRKLNQPDKAKKTFEKLLKIDPLNHYARFEQYLLDPSSDNLDRFNSLIRNEFPQETYLELALKYATDEGLRKEAIKVLKQAPDYPTVYYWLAYLHKDASGSKSQQYLKKAEEMSPHFVFPFRSETIPVLSWAKEQHASWKTTYYLGLIYWNNLRKDETRNLFDQLGDTPDYAPFYIARGRLLGETDSDNKKVISDYAKAKKLDSNEWRAWNYLTDYYLQTDSPKKQLNNAEDAFSRFSDNSAVGISYAKALFLSNKYKKALKVLDSIQILPQEHGKEGQIIYEQSYLALALENLKEKHYQESLTDIAKSKEYPRNLGRGKPFDPDIRFQDYTAAYIQTKLGNKRAAENLYDEIKKYTLEKGTKYHHGTPTENAAGIYIGSKILKMDGQTDKAKKLITNWGAEQDSLKNWRIAPGSSALPVQWTIAKAENQEQTVKKLEEKIYKETVRDKFQIFLETLKVINQ